MKTLSALFTKVFLAGTILSLGFLSFPVLNAHAADLNDQPTPPTTPDLRIDGIEVTQAIQDLNNSVLLVAGKRTFVRLYVSRGQFDYVNPPYIGASLEGFRNGVSLGAPILPANLSGQLHVVGQWDRRNLDDAFYFELPSSWIEAGQITLRATINPSHVFAESDYSNNILNSGILTFQAGKALRLRLVLLSYLRDGVRLSPSQSDIDNIVSDLRRIYPIPSLNYQQTILLLNCGGGTIEIMPSPCNSTFTNDPDHFPSTGDVANILTSLRQTLEPTHPGALIFGLYALPDDLEDLISGEAFPDGVADAWINNPDRSKFFDNLTALHEIGHLLGRTHVFCSGREGNPLDTQYPNLNGSIGGPPSTPSRFFGFDTGDYGFANPYIRRVIPPELDDFMSYCPKNWISDYTYTAIYNFIQSHPDVTMLNSQDSARRTRLGLQDISYPSRLAVVPGDYLSVYGTIDVSRQIASLSYLSRQTDVTEIPPREPGAYHILLLDAEDKGLADYAFTPLHGSDGDTRSHLKNVI